ncbi:uncharacterized protein SKDI_04G4900 [Saccharomyces kudriavzevii IFO 1802]|uniref:Uncharacterized protein n=2 Tax=Saccharomyces kudriavzevii (strain ATCC MYA-4449 / AS 2.2408 / CBS 8840 / NBRC 1802 / NCYC 2889) TaxID=226230 RepID=A0AA35JE61_SACK1|nr:uncharacterized protein SKDI_04G4900 [Saccharomyces kudriavzevii IFO 1802]CAI4058749.1 hypothetical protein SKDI_04G4900 [Saccharomyces kudriavzevii IFO 1802]
MATPMRDKTWNVLDDNISTQVQLKVKRDDAAINSQLSLKDCSIKDEQMRRYQRSLGEFKHILIGLKQEEETLSETDDIQVFAEKLLRLASTIEKVESRIQELVGKIQSIVIEENADRLHEHIDATRVYYLFDTLSSTNKRFYLKDYVFDYKSTIIENIPIFLSNFRKFIKKYQFDDVFKNEIMEIDPRENEIMCTIIKDGLNERLDITGTHSTNIFKIINDLRTKYRILHGREVRFRAWEKVLVVTTCRDYKSLMDKLQKLVLKEKCIFSKCCQDCPTLRYYLQEAILGTLHGSLRNLVEQRLHNHPHDSHVDYEEFLINTVIEILID